MRDLIPLFRLARSPVLWCALTVSGSQRMQYDTGGHWTGRVAYSSEAYSVSLGGMWSLYVTADGVVLVR
jgi:hypothetical protein